MCGLLFRKGAADKNLEPEEKRKAEVGSGNARGSQLAAGFAAPGGGLLWYFFGRRGRRLNTCLGEKRNRDQGNTKVLR